MQLLQTVQGTSNGSGNYFLDACLCEAGSTLCLSSSDHTIYCYDTHTSTRAATLPGHTCAIKDIIASPAHTSIIYSAQADTGVMVSDTRQQQPAHFLNEFSGGGAVGGTVGVNVSGQQLAIAVNGDTHIVDTRTWHSIHCIAQMHLDEITRIRFLDETVYCSAGEDQMINFIDAAPQVKDNDILLQAITCGEVVTKMTPFAELGILGLIGSCENAYMCPFDLEQRESRISRPDDAAYLVDYCFLNGQLHLLRGTRDDEGNAGPLTLVNVLTQNSVQLQLVHREMCRIAIGLGDRLITAGEDNILAFWQPSEDKPSSILDSATLKVGNIGAGINNGGDRRGPMMKMRHGVTRPLRSMPYAK